MSLLDPVNARIGQSRPRQFNGSGLFGASRGGGGGGPSYSEFSFFLPLGDKGGGVVDINPRFALGSYAATYTRASSAYTFDPTYKALLIGSGVPRSIYSPGGIYLGYQAEGARSNALGTTNAIVRDMSDAGWVAGVTATKGAATGIDGVANAAASITFGAVQATNTVLFTTVLGSAAYTYAPWVRRRTGVGTVEITDNGGTNWTTIAIPSSIIYTQFQITRTQANPVVGFRGATNGDVIEVDFNTVEAASFANPTPIPVNVSKAADILNYPFAGNASTASGFVYGEALLSTATGLGMAFVSTAAGSALLQTALGTNITCDDGVNTADKTGLTNMTGGTRKRAGSWGAAGLRVTGDGATPATQTFDGAISSTNISIGSAAGGLAAWSGSIMNIRFGLIQPSDATLSAMTA